jgi:gliding motility-associated-like protein
MEVCPTQTYEVNNLDANKTFCPNCEDDFNFCFTANNTIWFKFTTNANGGAVNVNITDLVFQQNAGQGNALQATLLSGTVPCQADSYTTLGNCETDKDLDFTLSANALTPNTTYFVVVNGVSGTSSAAECAFTISITGVAIDRQTPAIQIDNGTPSVCAGETYKTTASVQNCPDNSTFKWYVNDVFTAESTVPAFEASDLKDGDKITVKTTCYSKCPEQVSVTSIPISVFGFPLDAGEDLHLKPGSTGQLQASTTAASFVWTPSYNISDTLSLSPFIFPDKTTTYTISATKNECTKFDYVNVYIDDELTIPTTFSPNEDGINDTWEIPGAEAFPNCYVQIFDRWGQEIFQAIGYNSKKAWDGQSKGGNATEGVYFYVVKLRDPEKREYKGTITLIR